MISSSAPNITDTRSGTVFLRTGKYYDFTVQCRSGYNFNISSMKIEWMYSDQTKGKIPSKYLFYPERVQGKVIKVKDLNPSIRNKSTIVSKQENHIAGIPYSMTIQCRDEKNNICDSKDKVYRIYFTQSDGRGS